jgi:hypothetical protein
LADNAHSTEAVENAGWSVTCEHGRFNRCGTQLTALMSAQSFLGIYCNIFGDPCLLP